MEKQHKHIGFTGLEHHVQAEYEHAGYGKKRAEHIGQAVAGKVYREQRAKKR